MIIAYIFIALFIAFLWLRYFRDIDVFEREQWLPMSLSFGLGGGSVFLLFFLNDWFLDHFQLDLNGNWWDDFLFIALKVAGPEESVKVITFLLAFVLMRKHFNEPLDYLIYCSLSALGFSAVENVLYFITSGGSIIVARGILSTVGHMFDTALFAYGLILYQFRYKRSKSYLILVFFGLSVLAHTAYNFPLMHAPLGHSGYYITTFIFLLTISIYAVILNNALNQSPFFKEEILVNATKVRSRLISGYLILFFIQMGILQYEEGPDFLKSILFFRSELLSTGFIVLISSTRLSRFLLIKSRWFPLKIELPFGATPYTESSIEKTDGRFMRIKGEAYDATKVHAYLGKEAKLRPMNRKNSRLNGDPLIQVDSIHFIAGDLAVYKIHFVEGEQRAYGMAPKRKGESFVSDDNHPIMALFEWTEAFEPKENLNKLQATDLKLLEWVILLPPDFFDY